MKATGVSTTVPVVKKADGTNHTVGLCNGAAYNTTTYSVLYAALNNTSVLPNIASPSAGLFYWIIML